MTSGPQKCKICTVRTYGEHCPIAKGAEAIGDRWTPLVLRELICGSRRFTEIHRGVPRMSRALLVQRLERLGTIERRRGPTYDLTAADQDLEAVVWGDRGAGQGAPRRRAPHAASAAAHRRGERTRRELVRAFPTWFALSPFAARV